MLYTWTDSHPTTAWRPGAENQNCTEKQFGGFSGTSENDELSPENFTLQSMKRSLGPVKYSGSCYQFPSMTV